MTALAEESSRISHKCLQCQALVPAAVYNPAYLLDDNLAVPASASMWQVILQLRYHGCFRECIRCGVKIHQNLPPHLGRIESQHLSDGGSSVNWYYLLHLVIHNASLRDAVMTAA